MEPEPDVAEALASPSGPPPPPSPSHTIPTAPLPALKLTISDAPRRRRFTLVLEDAFFTQALEHEVLVASADDAVELSMTTFVRCIDESERIRLSVEATGSPALLSPRRESGSTPGSSSPASPSASNSSSMADTKVTKGSSDRRNTIEPALTRSLEVDSGLFFDVAKESYELSRDPLSGGRYNIWVAEGHCLAFQLCVRVFAAVFNQHIRPVAPSYASFGTLRLESLLAFRRVVWSSFHLQKEDPTLLVKSESNLEPKWIFDNIQNDKYFFPTGQHKPIGSLQDVTLSWVTTRKPDSFAANPTTALGENEMQTFFLTQLLDNPTWEPEDSCAECRQCHRVFKSVSRPLGTRAHHCRCCGRRLCGFCITKKAHRSFAKLSKPGGGEEGEERYVCSPCYEQYLGLERLRYLGALFAFAGLDFRHLALCRTVNTQWRNAAELCISEYRLLLHTCAPDLHSVLTPVGALLENSQELIVHKSAAGHAKASLVVHPEPALLLLMYIAVERRWQTPFAQHFVPLLATCSLKGRLQFGHWHFFCTAFCSKTRPTFFSAKAIEWLGWAPEECAYAKETMVQLAQRLQGRRSGGGGTATSTKLAPPSPSSLPCGGLPLHPAKGKHAGGSGEANHAAVAAATPTPALASDVSASPPPDVFGPVTAEEELLAVWLVDLLFRDAQQRRQSERRYQAVLEVLVPRMAAEHPSLALFFLTSLQSLPARPPVTFTYASVPPQQMAIGSYDAELIALWRVRILAEVGSAPVFGPTRRARIEATLHFFHTLDTYCASPQTQAGGSGVAGWIRYYCSANGAALGVATTLSLTQVSPEPHPAIPPSTATDTTATPSPLRTQNTSSSAVAVAPTTSKHVEGVVTGAPSAGSSLHRHGSEPVLVDLPQPILHPFKPWIVLRSVVLSAIRVEPSSTRPVWITFSTESQAQRSSSVTFAAAPPSHPTEAGEGKADTASVSTAVGASSSAGEGVAGGEKVGHHNNNSTRGKSPQPPQPLQQVFSFLYKRENVDCDQLMCISSRLLHSFLREEIGKAEMGNYSVLPLSHTSGLIEKAEGYVLSSLPGLTSPVDITTYLGHRGDVARVNFLASAKLFLLLNYIFSIGDRHQGNVMMSPTGAILHIDFGFLFSQKTLVEKIAGTSMRVDNQFLAAVVSSRVATNASHPRALPSNERGRATTPQPSVVSEQDAFFAEAAAWFLEVRPYANVFYQLWLYAVHRGSLPVGAQELAHDFNTLFDRSAPQKASADSFIYTMKQSINVCRLKDVTHSGVQALRSYADQVSRRVTEGSMDAVRALGSMWSSWRGTNPKN